MSPSSVLPCEAQRVRRLTDVDLADCDLLVLDFDGVVADLKVDWGALKAELSTYCARELDLTLGFSRFGPARERLLGADRIPCAHQRGGFEGIAVRTSWVHVLRSLSDRHRYLDLTEFQRGRSQADNLSPTPRAVRGRLQSGHGRPGLAVELQHLRSHPKRRGGRVLGREHAFGEIHHRWVADVLEAVQERFEVERIVRCQRHEGLEGVHGRTVGSGWVGCQP